MNAVKVADFCKVNFKNRFEHVQYPMIHLQILYYNHDVQGVAVSQTGTAFLLHSPGGVVKFKEK